MTFGARIFISLKKHDAKRREQDAREAAIRADREERKRSILLLIESVLLAEADAV